MKAGFAAGNSTESSAFAALRHHARFYRMFSGMVPEVQSKRINSKEKSAAMRNTKAFALTCFFVFIGFFAASNVAFGQTIEGQGFGQGPGDNAQSYTIDVGVDPIGDCTSTIEAEWTGSYYDVTCDGAPVIDIIEVRGSNTFVVDGREHFEGGSREDRLSAMFSAMVDAVR